MKIFVIAHKIVPCLQDDTYQPLLVGGNEDTLPAGWLRDNTGDNISHLNGMRNEMTGIYRVRKNYTAFDHIGFCHYRRYFGFYSLFQKINQLHPYEMLRRYEANYKDLKKLAVYPQKRLKKYDMIVTRPFVYPRLSIAELYSIDWLSYDIKMMMSAIVKMHPHLEDKVKKYFSSLPGKLYAANMFIMSKKEFYEYCEFVFPILFSLQESILDPDGVKVKRSIGYLSERLSSFYFFLMKSEKNVGLAKTIGIRDFM